MSRSLAKQHQGKELLSMATEYPTRPQAILLLVTFASEWARLDAITIANGENMIFDHVSISWGRDETFSINGDVSNVTISDSIIAQGLQTHSCGGLIQTDGGVSIIRSLYIDNNTRNPKVKGVNEFVNNVVILLPPWPVVSDIPRQVTRGNANFHTYVSNNYYDPDQVRF
ncbi:hypothetical protein C0989_009740 [Termitomyces sp. Mn162]|nr:hypothetical protein C0989_009740 [Termitomyces sp. Mn162]